MLLPTLRMKSVRIRPSIILSRSSAAFTWRSMSVMRTSFCRLGRLMRVRLRIATSCSTFGWMARPLKRGCSTDCVSTYTRAVASKRSGVVKMYAAPARPASQATASPSQRTCQRPRSTCFNCGTKDAMQSRSEPALRDDQHIAGLHLDVRRYVAAAHEVLQAHAVLLAAVLRAQDRGVVAVGEIGQAADRDHDVEQGHLLPVGQRLRPRRLADHADLLAVRAVESG